MKGIMGLFTKKAEPKKKLEYGIRMNNPGLIDFDDIYPSEQEHAKEFFEGYKWKLDRDPEYRKKDIDEYIEYHKFFPVQIPYKFEGNFIYSYIEHGKWMKIGRLETNKVETVKAQKRKLFLKPNIYKIKKKGVTEETEGLKYFYFPYKM